MLVFRSNRSLLASSLVLSLSTTSISATALLGCTTSDERSGVEVASSTSEPTMPVTVTAAGATQDAKLKLSDIDKVEALLPAFKADGITTTDSTRLFQATQISVRGPDGTLLRWTRSGNTLTSLDDSTRSLRWDLSTGELEIRGAGGSSRTKVMGDPTDIQRVIGTFVRVGIGDSSSGIASALGGGEVVVIVVVVAFSSWMMCLTLGTGVCGAMAYLNCPNGVDWFKMNCGINVGSLGGTDSMIGDLGSLGSCTWKCADNSPPNPDPPTFPGPGLPLPPVIYEIPSLGDCPEGQHMDFCIVGWEDSGEFTDGEVTVTTTPVTELCCVPNGTP